MNNNMYKSKIYRALKSYEFLGFPDAAQEALRELEELWLHQYVWVGNEPYYEKDILELLKGQL